MADKKISELPAATEPLNDADLVEIVQGGVNKKAPKSAFGGGAVDSVNGQTGVVVLDQNDVTAVNRSVTGTDAVVQTDANALIKFNSATPFNFTLDQLTSGSQVSYVNYGAGAVTLVAGTGVTITGRTVVPAAVGNDYPGGLIVWDSATAVRTITGQEKEPDLETVSTAGATITCDCNNQTQRMFIGSASFGTAKAVTFSNDTPTLVRNLVLDLSNVAAVLTFDADVLMQATQDSRWSSGAKTFTPIATGVHEFSQTWNGTNWLMKASHVYS